MTGPLDSNATLLPGITNVAINGGVTPVSGVVPVTFTLPTGYGLSDVFVAVDGALLAVRLNGARLLGNQCTVLVNVGTPGFGSHVVSVFAAVSDWSHSRVYVSGNTTWNNHLYVGGAVHFASNSLSRCELQSSAFNAGAAGTLACWVKIDSPMATALQPFSHYDGGHFGFLIQVSAAGAAKLRIISPSVAITDTPTVSLTLDTWHLLVGAYDGAGCYFSVDGANYVTGSAPAAPYTGLTYLALGSAHGDVGNTPCAVDEAGYWMKKLSQVEVGYLWNNNVGLAYYDAANNATYASLLTSLVDWYDCDDVGGHDLVSATGSGRTLVGIASPAATYTVVAGVR